MSEMGPTAYTLSIGPEYAKFARLAGHFQQVFFNQMSNKKLQMSGEAQKNSRTLHWTEVSILYHF